MSKLWSVALTILVAATSLFSGGPQAHAGWGHHWHRGWGYYPAWSAWGYPAWSYPAWGFSRVTTYSVGPGWGYYGGFGCWPRHRYYSYYGPRVINYSVALPTYYYVPASYGYPTYSAPIVAPVPAAPTVCLPTPLVKSTSARSDAWQAVLRPSASPALVNGAPVNGALVNRLASSPAASVRLVTAAPTSGAATNPAQFATATAELPIDLLQRTDDLFGRGHYAEAAAAYARLTVSYGNHDVLAARRFIALIASGDCHQAAVIFELASLSGKTFSMQDLPSGGLETLYGSHSSQRSQHIETLADYGLKNTNDGVALAMVGTWLQLDGQAERARPFMERAASLAPGSTPNSPSTSSSSHLVATTVSR